MNLSALPDQRAAEHPLGPAVADDKTDLDNAQFLSAVRRAAASLRGHGVSAGDVVAIMLPNTASFVVSLFAAWRLGAAVTPINPSLRPAEVTYQVSDARAKVLIVEKTPEFDAGVPAVETDQLDNGESVPGADAPHEGDDALALLIYTSGTTGRPKGVMLDHANLDAMCNGVIDAFKLTGADHSLLILPLFHVNGIVVGTLSPLLAGGRATVAGRFRPESFFDRIEQSRPTYFSAVPTIYTMLCGLPASLKPDTSSVRFAICGAAPASVELLEAFESRYGIPIIEGYGLSEGSCASTVNPLDGERKPGTVGLPVPGQTIRIVDTEGRAVPDGQPGEVVIKGPNVMRGYLNRPEETAKSVVDGWLHTGDVGRLDEDGYLVLVDRAKDMIIRGGENIYPREIEAVAHGLPQIAEAAVVGRANAVYGEEPVLFVSLHPRQTLDTDAIRAHLSESLSKYKLPVEITIMDDLPKNAVGKIDKPTLRKRLVEYTLKNKALTSQRSVNHGIHQTGLPRRRSGHLHAETAHGADADPRHRLGGQRIRITTNGAHHLHREAGFLLRARRHCGRDTDVRASVPSCFAVVEPAHRLREGRSVDRAAGTDRRCRIMGPAGRQDQADDRWHPVLGPAGHHPATAVEVGAVDRRRPTDLV